MFREVVEQETLLAYLKDLQLKTHEHLQAGGGGMRVPDAAASKAELEEFVKNAQKELATYPPEGTAAHENILGLRSSFPFVPRSALLSLLQNRVERCGRAVLADEHGRENAVPTIRLGAGQLPAVTDEHFPRVGRESVIAGGAFEPYGPCDWRWVVCKVAEWTKKGNHPFNAQPAKAQIAAKTRLVLLSDWASGIPRAAALSQSGVPKALATLEAGFETHVIHLGDTYYVGEEEEQREHVLDLWPDLEADARAWALPGNHDYYSGAWAFFGTLLGDPRFAAQRSSDGKPSSLFELSSDRWRIIGLDTAAAPHDHDMPKEGWAFLERSLAEAQAAGQCVIVLSHHQQRSAYSDVPVAFAERCNALLRRYPVAAWLWGHEHRCTVYEESAEIKLAACIGNGGLPDWVASAALPAGVRFDCEKVYDDPDDSSSRWRAFGFAVLDLEPNRLTTRFFLEDGGPYEQPIVVDIES